MENINLVCTALLALLLSVFFLRRKSKLKGTPPGSLGWPLIGETLEYHACQRRGAPQEFVKTRIAKYGNIFKTSLIGTPTVVFAGPEGNRFLFSNENKLVVFSWPKSVHDIFRKSILATSGEEAKRIQRALMNFLGPEALQNFVRKADDMTVSHFAQHWIGKEEVIVHPLINRFVFSLACTMFLSITREHEQHELYVPFEDLVSGVMQLPVNLPGTRYRKALRSRDKLVEIVGKHLRLRRESLRRGEVSPNQDLLSYLISQGDGLSDVEIEHNIILLMFAGHESSSRTLTFLIKFLAENPSCFDKILQEHKQIVSTKSRGESLQWKDLQEMKYTWRAVQETLRLQPAGTGGFRKVIQEFTYQGYRIPKGWKAYWTWHTTHKSEEYFKDVERFNPDRFEDEGPMPYTFVAFGGGPRVCPGSEFSRMMMLVFVHHLLKNFIWELVDPTEMIIVDPMPIPKKGLPIKLVPHAL